MKPFPTQIAEAPQPWSEGTGRLAMCLTTCLGFVMAAHFYNRTPDPVWVWVCFVFVLGSCCLPGQTAVFPRLKFGRQGWSLSFSLLLAMIVLFHAGFLAFFKVRLGALILRPDLADACRFLAERAVWFAPLAFLEELFFRAWLQETVFAALWGQGRWGFLSRKNLAAAFLFGSAHWAALGQPIGMLTVFPGLLLGWVMERSHGGIWPAVGLHLGLNLLLVWARQLVLLNSPWL